MYFSVYSCGLRLFNFANAQPYANPNRSSVSRRTSVFVPTKKMASTSMIEDVLTSGESFRLSGSPSSAMTSFRTVLRMTSSDLHPSSSASSSRRRSLSQMRAVATYQLALLLLQSSGGSKKEGEALLWKLGFRGRLSDAVLSYDLRHFSPGREPTVVPPSPAAAAAPALVLDGALSEPHFKSLQSSLSVASSYWSAHGYPTSTFFSYNIPLQQPERRGRGKSPPPPSDLLTQTVEVVLSLLRSHLPSLSGGSSSPPLSAEVWAHSRPSDGHHQLHYDLDELSLHLSGKPSSPLVSCVLYIDVPSPSSVLSSAPTLLCDRRLDSTAAASNAGWLSYPLTNRLLAFDGRLLHAVVPGVVPPPEPVVRGGGGGGGGGGEGRRVTLMIGYWPSGVSTSRYDLSCLGPNMPLPRAAKVPSWLKDLQPSADYSPVSDPVVGKLVYVPSVWVPVPAGKASDFGVLADEDVSFTGRFFLRSGDPKEIDDEVLRGGAAAAAAATKPRPGGGHDDEEDDDEGSGAKKKAGGGKRKAETAKVKLMSVEDSSTTKKPDKAKTAPPIVEMMTIEDALKMSSSASKKQKGK